MLRISSFSFCRALPLRQYIMCNALPYRPSCASFKIGFLDRGFNALRLLAESPLEPALLLLWLRLGRGW